MFPEKWYFKKIVHFGISIHFLCWRQQKHQWLCFHYWDYLTNFWHNNWRSIIDVVERLCFSVCAINSLLFLNQRLLSYFLTKKGTILDHRLWIKTEFSSNMSKQKVTRIWTGLLPDSWHLFYSLFPFWDREEEKSWGWGNWNLLLNGREGVLQQQ